MFAPGHSFGNYEICGPLESGGMATLLLARRNGVAGFRQTVAIKVIHEHLSDDPAILDMFLDEARLAAQIAHPNVVSVQELGRIDDAYYLVMEYVHGATLSQLCTELLKLGRSLAPEIAVHIAMQIAEGLHAAHEASDEQGRPLSIVHRDISPQNVLLSHTGHVKVIDFGVAHSRQRLAPEGAPAVVGKLRYMAPEQALGGTVDRRADLYALGVVLWELLAMRPLFRFGQPADALDEAARTQIVPPSRFRPGIPEALDALLLRTLALQPEARPATAMELRRGLAEALPSASSIAAPQLADLLHAVLGEQLQQAFEALPQPVSTELRREAETTVGVRARGIADRQESLQQFTVVTKVSKPNEGEGSRVRARAAFALIAACALVGLWLALRGVRTQPEPALPTFAAVASEMHGVTAAGHSPEPTTPVHAAAVLPLEGAMPKPAELESTSAELGLVELSETRDGASQAAIRERSAAATSPRAERHATKASARRRTAGSPRHPSREVPSVRGVPLLKQLEL